MISEIIFVTFVGMNRFSKNTVNVTTASMQAMAGMLRKQAELLELMAKLCKDSDMEGVQAKSLITGIDGLKNIGLFFGYVATAYTNELSARGVGEIAGALHELQKQAKLFEALRDKEIAKLGKGKAKESKPDRKHLILYYVDSVTKKEVTRSAKTSDPKQAQRNAIRWEEELARHRGKQQDNWDWFRERFEAEHLAKLAPKTQAAYGTALNTFRKFWSGQSLGEISPNTISQFQADLIRQGFPLTSVGNYLRHLKAALRWAGSMNMMQHVPRFQMPRKGKGRLMKGRALTEAEIALLLKACPDEQWRRFVELLQLSGLRLAEACILSWEDPPLVVRLDETYPRIDYFAESHKAREDMAVPVSPQLFAWLQQTPPAGRKGLVCTLIGERGEPLTDVVNIGRTVSGFGRDAGIVTGKDRKGFNRYAGAHDLRRSFGTYWSTRVRPLTLQRMMRHKDFSTTLSYYVGLSIEEVANDLWSGVPKTVPTNAQERELMRWAECDFPEEL